MENKEEVTKEEIEIVEDQTELELLKKELELKDQEIQNYINGLKRLQADFENYIKRSEKDKIEFSKYASVELIIKLLEIIDDFERAIETIKNDENVKGLEMIFNQLKRTLEEEGVRPIISLGEKFDPSKHEVVSHLESNEHEEDVVMQEFQKGYWFKDKIARPSKVIISKNNSMGNENGK